MPNDVDLPRVVIDETSFDFREVPPGELSEWLHRFNDVLSVLRKDGNPAYKPPCFENTECSDDQELYEYLTSEQGRGADRDVRNRFYSLVDRCPEWNASTPAFNMVAIDGADPAEAWSVAFALTMVLGGRGVACLVFGGHQRRGFLPVAGGPALSDPAVSGMGRGEICFFAAIDEMCRFWRHLFALENVSEDGFFGLAGRAFPRLILHSSLSFRRFKGGYQDLRDSVVEQLAILNDHFFDAYTEFHGEPRSVQMALAAFGCHGLSPESPKTRSNAAAMRQRDVAYDGRVIRCEWHVKIRPDGERIHFAFGQGLGERILVSIFVWHLDT